jgi:Ca2+-binding EF-hand superfamily protein
VVNPIETLSREKVEKGMAPAPGWRGTMVKIVAVMVLGLVLWAQNVLAQDAETALGEEMRRNAGRFQDEVTDLIAGFGQNGALTLAGIEDHISLTRAAARATAVRRLVAQDLDADGTVSRRELAVVQAAASAAARGRLERQFTAADTNGDGRIGSAEAAADREGAALRALDQEEADLLRAVLTLDADGDGALTTTELAAAMLRLDEAT